MEEQLIRILGLSDILQRISQLETELAELKREKSGEGKFLTLTEVQELLRDKKGIAPSRDTLRKWHVDEILIQRRAGHKIYYLATDVYNMKSA